MQFDTKIAVVIRTDLEVWQKLNVASFLAGGIAAAFPECVGAPYEDGSATSYLALIGQPLLGPETAVTIRGGKRGGRRRTDGPFLETKEWLGGFTLIEARDMEEAIALNQNSAIMKYATIEIRPTLEQTHSETGQGRPEVKV